MTLLDLVEKDHMKKEIVAFRPGDKVKIHVKVTEGNKE